MKLHAENIAVEAGCRGDEIAGVAAKMISESTVSVSRAKEILSELRRN